MSKWQGGVPLPISLFHFSIFHFYLIFFGGLGKKPYLCKALFLMPPK